VALGTEWNANRSALLARFDVGGQPLIDAIRRDVPDGAIIIAPWADATSLAYGAFVERELGSRIVTLGWPNDFAARYPAWMHAKRVFIYANGYALAELRLANFPLTWLVPATRDADGQIFELRLPTGTHAP